MPNQNRPMFLAAISIVACALLSCGTKADNCANSSSCPPEGDGGNSSTKGSTAGTAIGGTATNDGGFAGLVSSGGSSVVAGAAGTTAQLPCNGACKGSTPYCDEFSQICVACLTDANCTGATPACDTETNVCVGCITDQHCPSGLPACTSTKICAQCTANTHCSGTRPACDTDTNVCVECLSSANCTNAAKPQCNADKKICVECLSNADCKTAAASKCDTTTNTCGPCGADTDCTQIPGKNVCLTGVTGQVNQCVQCTGKKYLACGQSNGKALVCDSLSHTCTTDKTVQSAGLCQPCVSDAQCSAGKLCYLETFNANSVGHFCFWKQGDTANGAPAACFTTANRPYVKVEADVASVDGETATLCTLRASTCTSYNQFSNIDCAPTGTPNDALCGFAPGTDSRCAETTSGSGVYRCTTVCLGNDDCKSGLTCDTGASPNVCTFQ